MFEGTWVCAVKCTIDCAPIHMMTMLSITFQNQFFVADHKRVENKLSAFFQIGEIATLMSIFRQMVNVSSPTNHKSILPTIHPHVLIFILSPNVNRLEVITFCDQLSHILLKQLGLGVDINFVTKYDKKSRKVEIKKSLL